jgi:hypothetical protein
MIPAQIAGRPIDLEDPLFVRLINCVTDADHQAFVDRFGDLGVEVGSDPQAVATYAGRLREGVEFALGGNRATTHPGVNAWTASRLLKGVSLQPLLEHRDGAMRFSLQAPHLAGFMAVEVAAAVEAGARSKRCERCHKLFLYGPLTGRRSHAKYCADRCRVAAMRARNAERGVEQ